MLEHFRRPHDVERSRTEGQRLDRCLYHENIPDVPEPMLKTLHSGHVIVDRDHVACSQQKMRHVLAAARADIEREARFSEARDEPAFLPDRGVAASGRASAIGGQAPHRDSGGCCGLTRRTRTDAGSIFDASTDTVIDDGGADGDITPDSKRLVFTGGSNTYERDRCL